MQRIFLLFLAFCCILCIDFYVYQGIMLLIGGYAPVTRIVIQLIYGIVSSSTIIALVATSVMKVGFQTRFFKYWLRPIVFIQYISKLFFSIFVLLDKVVCIAKWVFSQITAKKTTDILQHTHSTHSEFLMKFGITVTALPLVAMTYGIISGAHNYRVRKIKIKLPHLPKNFHGLKIGQLSDIHSGSFFNQAAVKKGVAMLLAEKPDVIFFTGDLVNDKADEVIDYVDIFSQIKAPLGVYSILGNHDYGDYITWPSPESKYQNFLQLCAVHKKLGWNLLRNENKIIQIGEEQLAIIGVENWGKGPFHKYGKLAKACQGTEEILVKLLLSHDPSHWDAEIKPYFPSIDITFSGHTHGLQFGIEIGSFKWSPVQYLYKQWAGLYQDNNQYLYVNRGFGYIGYPGRIGILPEITIVELERN